MVQNEPEKLLWSKMRVARLMRRERSGIGPERELLLRLIILSWVSFDKEWDGKLPCRFKFWTSYSR
jgi:hypothetical protein